MVESRGVIPGQTSVYFLYSNRSKGVQRDLDRSKNLPRDMSPPPLGDLG